MKDVLCLNCYVALTRGLQASEHNCQYTPFTTPRTNCNCVCGEAG